MSTNTEYIPQKFEEEEESNFLDIVKLCLTYFFKNWYWFLLSVTLCRRY